MADARSLSAALGGRWHGRYGTAPCPCCQPERHKGQNALTLADGRDGRLLLNCKKSACNFADIATAAGIRSGDYHPPDPALVAQREREERTHAAKRARQAERCWTESMPIGGTIAETYLRGRGITCDLPSTLRFHGACWHGPTARRHPALVALIEGADDFAVHRTYLRPDGTGKAAIDPAKAMLGAVAGGAVRLTETQGPLVVAEGIETALALASGLLGRPATVWAALSTSGMRALRLPCSRSSGSSRGAGPRLTIATDGDDPGRAAGHDLAERAHATGWAVSLLPAPDGRDWCDVLAGKAVTA